MYRTYTVEHVGYCPTQHNEESVQVGYNEFRVAGNSSAIYKKVNFRCGYFQRYSCEFTKECPIFLDAPDVLP